jgi:hypothetical protein
MPELTNPLGEPYIIKPEDWINLSKASGYVAGTTSILPTMTALTEAGTSLVDNAYAQQTAYKKSQADLAESMAKTQYYGAESDNIQSESDQRKQLTPLEVQAKQQLIQQNGFAIKEAQRQSNELDQANGEYEAWHTALSNLDPTDPDYDNKVASINAQYPHASTNPSTQRLITPLLQQQNVRRSQSTQVQQRTDQMNQLQDFQKKGLLPPDVDVRAEVNGGNGQNQINNAKQQATINRLQNVQAYGSLQQRTWAQNEIDRITGKGLGPGETADRTMFTPNGDLNPGTEALLSSVERSFTPAPGVSKETKTETDDTGTKTTTTIKGQPVSPSEVAPKKQAQTLEAPTTQEEMLKDPDFQQVWDDAANGRIQLPADAKPGTPQFAAAVMAEYAARKQLKANAGAPKNTITPTAPAVPGRVPGPQRAKKTSYQAPTQEDTDVAIQDALTRNRFASIEPGVPAGYRAPQEGGESSAPFSGSFRAMAYGPSQGEYTHATNYGPLGHLQQGDIAVSPNLLSKFPIGSYVDVVDEKGNVLRAARRVADTSWINADKPTTNSFELWNDKDLGHARLVPAEENTATTTPMPIHESGHPMPRTPREALTLGPGTRFMAPDGTLRMVPE